MSAADSYWASIAKTVGKTRAQEANVEASFRSSGQDTAYRLEALHRKRMTQRMRGKKVLCLGCRRAKPRAQFRPLRTGRVSEKCRACLGLRSHKKKKSREIQ